MPDIRLSIPDNVAFSDLHLARDADMAVSFDWAPIESIYAANGLDVSIFREGPEDNISGLITAWYFTHLQSGGAPDPVQEDILAEIRAEDERGDGVSHQPGRA